jgi:ketosteroid isomerase-like protein
MSELRSTAERTADVRAALARHRDAWLATASASGRPHLIAVSAWWDGSQVTIATITTSLTARNLDATGLGRLALGSPDDVIVIDTGVSGSVRVDEAHEELRAGFAATVGWDPAEEEGTWRFFRLLPVRIQTYRGYGELPGREVMRDSRWLEEPGQPDTAPAPGARERAARPEDLARLFVERANAGDVDGLAELYESNAVLGYPPGQVTVGREAIRSVYERMLAGWPHMELEEALPTLRSGDLALTSTCPKDEAGARAQVARRQADGTWLRILDRPETSTTSSRPGGAPGSS